MNHLKTNEENLLILLASDCLHHVALFGCSDIEKIKINTFAKEYMSSIVLRNSKNFDYPHFKKEILNINKNLLQRINCYENNWYFKQVLHETPPRQCTLEIWKNIANIAAALPSLDGLINPPDETVINALFKIEGEWWTGDILNDAINNIRYSETDWDEQLESLLEYEYPFELIARRAFSHPKEISFLYNWCSQMGVESYLVVKDFMLKELSDKFHLKKLPKNLEDAFLFF